MKKYFMISLCFVFCMALMLSGCKAKIYKVEFIVDNEIISTIETKGNEELDIPTPTKDDYLFGGWFLDKDKWEIEFTSESLLDKKLSEDLKVYAKWNLKNDDTSASFLGFEKTSNNEYKISLSNTTNVLNMSELVEVYQTSTWTLCTDISANNSITSKTATLEVGNNTYYVLVTAQNGDVELYTLIIRRRPIYLVTFETNEGTIIESQNIEENELIETPQIPLKTGYTFSNWDYDLNIPITQNTTISAKYNPNTYKIKYHYNSEIVEQAVIFDSVITLKPNTTFSRTAYDLTGWNSLENGNGELYTCSQEIDKYKFASDIDLYSIWTPTTYNITYHYNGGSNVDNIEEYNIETDYTLLQSNKTGYNFSNWCTDIELNNPITNLVGKHGNLNLYAKWTAKNYIVNLNSNGGECDISTINTTFDKPYGILPIPTRSAYRFDGWYYNESKIEDENWIYDTTEIIARWIPIFTTTNSNNEITITGLSEYGKTLEIVNVPESIDNINVCYIYSIAFRNDNIKELTLPRTIKDFDNYVCYICPNLEIINFNCEQVQDSNFSDTTYFPDVGTNTNGLTIKIGANVKIIPSCMFNGLKIKEVIFENNSLCTFIGKNAFEYSEDRKFYIDDIKNWAKIDFKTADSSIPQSQLYINNQLIGNDIKIDSINNRIGNYAFCYYYFENVEIVEGVSIIGKYSFKDCYIKTITLPKSLIKVEDSAFYQTDYETNNLEKVIYNGTLVEWVNIEYEQWTSSVFAFAKYNCEFYINNIKLNEIVITNDIRLIKCYSFYGLSNSVSITFENVELWYCSSKDDKSDEVICSSYDRNSYNYYYQK